MKQFLMFLSLLTGNLGACKGDFRSSEGGDAKPHDTVDAAIDILEVHPSTPTLRAFASARGFVMGTELLSDGDVVPPAVLSNYKETIAAQYNSVTPNNAMDFSVIHPSQTKYVYTNADAAVAFAQENGITIDGHLLIWYAWNPVWLTSGGFSKTELLAILKDHITTVVTHFAGKVSSWDVVNEALTWDGRAFQPGVWLDTIGPEYIDSAVVWARQADPAVKLYYMDYGAEPLGMKSDSVYALVKGLKARGIPIDGVGFQAHGFPAYSPAPSTVAANFARFAAAGFDIRVTEMDNMIPDAGGPDALITQAIVYRDLLDACLLQPRCKEFTTWGFTDAISWIPKAWPGYGRGLPMDSAYKAKPAFDSLAARLGRQ